MKFTNLFHRLGPSQPAPIKRQRRDVGTFSGTINPQTSLPFFSRLPAEIRNEIYFYVFVVDPPFSIDPWHPNHIFDHHPLSLLLTCRLINAEASVLAFRVYTFHISGDISFHGLRLRTTGLPNVYFDAITSISCMPWPEYRKILHRKLKVTLLGDILCLFQNIRNVNVKPCRTIRGAEEWVRLALEGVVESKRGNWKIVENDCVKEGGGSSKVSRMEEVSVHIAEDEESGRRVMILFDCGDCPGTNWESLGVGRLGTLLRVARENKDVKEVKWKSGKMGFEYDPGAEYWADLRNRRSYERRGEVDRGRDEDLPGL